MTSAAPIGQSVVLLHELPDGSSHLDWMIEKVGKAEALITFRVATGIALDRAGRFEAERLADHRREYLEYEGAVSRGRGTVKRVGHFGVKGLEIEHDSLRVILRPWGGQGLSGEAVEWRGRAAKKSDPGGGAGVLAWEFIGAVC